MGVVMASADLPKHNLTHKLKQKGLNFMMPYLWPESEVTIIMYIA